LANPDQKRTPQDANDPSVRVHGAIEAHLPQDLLKKHDTERKEDAAEHVTERKEDRRSETYKLLLELGTFLAVVIYAFIALWQGVLTRDIIKNTQENFIRDQRPYVWPAVIEEVPMKVGQAGKADIYFVNYGKKPALDIRLAVKILVSTETESAFQKADVWFSKYHERSKLGYGSQIILPQGIPPDPRATPNSYSTADTDKIPPTEDAVNLIQNTNFSYAIVGVVSYFDIEGRTYRTEFCRSHFATGAAPWCPKHNEID